MSSPMVDVPDHLLIPVNQHGQGPVDEAATVALACWCGTQACPVDLDAKIADIRRRKESAVDGGHQVLAAVMRDAERQHLSLKRSL